MPTGNILQQALQELAKLPDEDQQAITARWLDELKDEQAWSQTFDATPDYAWDELAERVRRDIACGDTSTLDDFLAEHDTE